MAKLQGLGGIVSSALIIVASTVLLPALDCFGAPTTRVLTFVGTNLGMLVLFMAAGVAITGQKLGVLWDARNVYSLSRLQMTLWTLLVLSALIAVVACLAHGLFDTAGTKGTITSALNVKIPTELLQAMGISYLSGAIAPAVLSLKTQTSVPTSSEFSAASARVGQPVTSLGRVFIRPRMYEPLFRDLVQGDDISGTGTVDLSKLQQLIVTLLLVSVYLAMLFDFFLAGTGGPDPSKSGITTLPPLSASFVYLLGLSHVGYLAYKAAPAASAPLTPQAQTSVPNTAAQRPLPPVRS